MDRFPFKILIFTAQCADVLAWILMFCQGTTLGRKETSEWSRTRNSEFSTYVCIVEMLLRYINLDFISFFSLNNVDGSGRSFSEVALFMVPGPDEQQWKGKTLRENLIKNWKYHVYVAEWIRKILILLMEKTVRIDRKGQFWSRAS